MTKDNNDKIIISKQNGPVNKMVYNEADLKIKLLCYIVLDL